MAGTANRRGFLSTSLTGAAAATGGFVPDFAWTATAFANTVANDRPRIGCIGVGSMGTGDAHGHATFGDIVAVCDVDNRHAERALKENAKGKGPTKIDGTDAKHPVPFKDGYPTVDDCSNTSQDFTVNCTLPSGVQMVVTSRGDNGILFEGTKGRIFVNRQKITGAPIKEGWDKDQFTDADAVALYKGKPFEGHQENFYRCIREGGLPVSDVFSHVATMNTCHLAGIAARLGRTITWDPSAEKIVGAEQAAAFAARKPPSGYEILRV